MRADCLSYKNKLTALTGFLSHHGTALVLSHSHAHHGVSSTTRPSLQAQMGTMLLDHRDDESKSASFPYNLTCLRYCVVVTDDRPGWTGELQQKARARRHRCK